jgi:hypothetical protein
VKGRVSSYFIDEESQTAIIPIVRDMQSSTSKEKETDKEGTSKKGTSTKKQKTEIIVFLFHSFSLYRP